MRMSLQIKPLDPIMARDGRPFGMTPGARAHSMNTVSSSTVSGTIRTLLAKQLSDPELQRQLYHFDGLTVRGPIHFWGDMPYFPYPEDMDWNEDGKQITIHAIRPVKPSDNEGFWGIGPDSRFDGDKLWPPEEIRSRKKSNKRPAFISGSLLTKWLCNESLPAEAIKAAPSWESIHQSWSRSDADKEVEVPPFLAPFEHDLRTHVAIDAEKGRAKDQALFSTDSLVIPSQISLHSVILSDTVPADTRVHAIHPLGGKNRLAHFSSVPESPWWQCPTEIHNSLHGQKYIKLMLATPAYFAKGWLPGWLDEQLESKDTFHQNVKLRLRWACLPNWIPISGYSFNKHEKPVRRMVPAGSVYFFEVIDGDPAELANHKWLTSVSDDNRRHEASDREDGFGLALWGNWQPASQSI